MQENRTRCSQAVESALRRPALLIHFRSSPFLLSLRWQHIASPVLIAATLVASSTAIDFGDQNDITQSAATVAPGDESTNQWTQTTSSLAGVPPGAFSAPSSVSGSQGWPQPMTTDSPSAWTPTNDPATDSGNQGRSQPTSTDNSAPSGLSNGASDEGDFSLECSGSSDSETPETEEYSLECSGSDETTDPGSDYSLECSGSDDQEEQGSQPSVSTSTASSSNSNEPASGTPSISSGTGDQTWSQPSSTAASSDTTTSAETEGASPTSSPNTASSTASSESDGNADQGSSLATQTPSTASPSGPTSATQDGSDVTQTSTNSTSSGDHATFGTITSKSGECVIGNPNKYVSAADVDWVWDNRIGPDAKVKANVNWNVMENKNWIMDHIVNNKGTLNYCVRWDSTEKLSKATASKFQAMLERQYAVWNHWLIGYDCWPYNKIKINVVGFAVKDATLLDWEDDSLGTITVGDLDKDGVPQCDQTCYRFYDVGINAWTDTSGCKGEPFDLSLWPKQGLAGGFGFDWGQEVNLENMLAMLDEDQLTIVAHEIGHGFGLPDFYEATDKPNAKWPNCIMMAGSSPTVTDSDGWMLRRVLEHLKPRYKF